MWIGQSVTVKKVLTTSSQVTVFPYSQAVLLDKLLNIVWSNIKLLSY